MNEYNKKISNGFNVDYLGTEFMINTKFKGWQHITDKEDQKTLGDITDGSRCIDFKFDAYDNDNIVIEIKQKCGYGWLDELNDETIIMWVKTANGIISYAKVKDLKDFMQSLACKIRRPIDVYTGTIIKNFRLAECLKYIKGFKTINVSECDWWKNRPDIMKQSKPNTKELYSNKWFWEAKRCCSKMTVEEYEEITGSKVSDIDIEDL